MLATKRERALSLGADATVDAGKDDLADRVRAELGESADVVFDCVANEGTVSTAIRVALKGGTVVIVGGPRKYANIDMPTLQEYQGRLQGAATYCGGDFRDAIALLESNEFDSDSFITATFPLSGAADAFTAIATGSEVKILVTADRNSHTP